MTRASEADVMTPYVGDATAEPGSPKLTRFNALKNSGRIWSLRFSPNRTILKSEISVVACQGPDRIFRPLFPNVPFAGITKAAVLNHFVRLCSKPERGSPT